MDDGGNGATHPSEGQFPDSRSIGDHGRQIHQDAEALVETLRDATDGAQRYLATQIERQPFTTLGVAAGVGYVLGGGLGSRLTVLLLGAAARLTAALVARELGTRILQSDSASTSKEELPRALREPQRSDHEN